MTASHGEATGSLPVLTATYAAGDQDGLPSARATARLFPLTDSGERILLAVAESVGDPSSAEAQAAESLARIEATVARAPQEADVESILDAGYGAARDALRRLMSLPGSEPRAGVALVAAIVEDGAITAANVGRGAAFLRRAGRIVRLTADQRPEAGHYPPLLPGEGEAAQPLLSPAHPLQAGDTVLLCSEAIARGLGQQVIEAVVEDYGVDGAADELCDLAASLPEGAGAAAALLHLPASAAAPVVASPALPARVAAAGGSGASGRKVPLIVGAVIVAALIVAAAGIVYSATRSGNSGGAAVTRQTASSPTVQAVAAPVTPLAAAGGVTPAASESPTPSASSIPSPSPTPSGSATPGATGTPGSLANAPACDSGNTKPCRFTAQSGDTLSAIGDRFDITRACFEAANINHDPLPPRAPDYRIGAGETYLIPDTAGCAALPPVPAPPPAPVATARATAAATARVTASAIGTPSRVATPTARAGTAAPAASAAPATTAPSAGAPATAQPACTPTGGETFPRVRC